MQIHVNRKLDIDQIEMTTLSIGISILLWSAIVTLFWTTFEDAPLIFVSHSMTLLLKDAHSVGVKLKVLFVSKNNGSSGFWLGVVVTPVVCSSPSRRHITCGAGRVPSIKHVIMCGWSWRRAVLSRSLLYPSGLLSSYNLTPALDGGTEGGNVELK